MAADLICAATGLSKTAVKDCLNKGGVWLIRSGRKEQRVRKAKLLLRPGDRLSVYYDDAVLKLSPPPPTRLFHCRQYSIWDKPAGLLSQGTRFGDHCSLLRYVQKFGGVATPYLVHRLDREARGIVLVAHTSHAAAEFSELFRDNRMEKRYSAIASGILGKVSEAIRIDAPLDGKPAQTTITVLRHDEQRRRSALDIELHTGRYHQIRRHLRSLGHPLVGDARYGGEKCENGLQLTAYSLSFDCPFTHVRQRFSLEE